MEMPVFDTVFNSGLVLFWWTATGLYHHRIYLLRRRFVAPTTVDQQLPWWSEQHLVHSVTTGVLYGWVAVANHLDGVAPLANACLLAGLTCLALGLVFNPLVNVAHGRKWFRRPKGDTWPLPLFGVPIPNQPWPLLVVAALGLVLVALSHLLETR